MLTLTSAFHALLMFPAFISTDNWTWTCSFGMRDTSFSSPAALQPTVWDTTLLWPLAEQKMGQFCNLFLVSEGFLFSARTSTQEYLSYRVSKLLQNKPWSVLLPKSSMCSVWILRNIINIFWLAKPAQTPHCIKTTSINDFRHLVTLSWMWSRIIQIII